MIQRLFLSSKHVGELKKLAMDSLPLESCALLAGKITESDVLVKDVIMTKNADRSRVSFSVEPAELLDAYRKAEAQSLEIIAIFHSHPAPAEPSGKDARYMELNPIPWLIMSSISGQLRAFLYDNAIRELELVVEN